MGKLSCCNSKINITQFILCILITILFLLSISYLYKRYKIKEGNTPGPQNNPNPATITLLDTDEARAIQQGTCKLNETYGVYPDCRTMWVDKGCQGMFNVCGKKIKCRSVFDLYKPCSTGLHNTPGLEDSGSGSGDDNISSTTLNLLDGTSLDLTNHSNVQAALSAGKILAYMICLKAG